MAREQDLLRKDSYQVLRERLVGTQGYLRSFSFHRGANFYVLSYEKKNSTKHIFIDTGDSRYRKSILSILTDNSIDPANIEKIIITHRHSDHCGLADLLAANSETKILVHANFRHFIEGELTQEERRWLGNFNPSVLKNHNMLYLVGDERNKPLVIGGVKFPILGEPISINEMGKLVILACPKGVPTHSPDQIIILYSVSNEPTTLPEKGDFLPTDNILFSGDLWLMQGPHFHLGIDTFNHLLRINLRKMRNLVSGNSVMTRNAREQDADVKDALKHGFGLIRVKPGHGDEFIGSRIVPNSILANRDLLLKLGYPPNSAKSTLRDKRLAPKITAIEEEAYTYFTRELTQWQESGYTWGEITELLVRIYQEQSGGGPLVKQDREERRRKLTMILLRLKGDKSKSTELRSLAETTLAKLKLVRR